MDIYSARTRLTCLKQAPAAQPSCDSPAEPVQVLVNDRGTLLMATKTMRDASELERSLSRAVKVQIETSFAKHHQELISNIAALMGQRPLCLGESPPMRTSEKANSPKKKPSAEKNGTPKHVQLDPFRLQKMLSPKPEEDVQPVEKPTLKKKLTRGFSNLNNAVKKVEYSMQQSREDRMLELAFSKAHSLSQGSMSSQRNSSSTDGHPPTPERQDSASTPVRDDSKTSSIVANYSQEGKVHWLRFVLNSPRFELVMGLLVLTNAVFIGWEVDYIARQPDVTRVPQYCTVMSYGYAAMFLIELFLRIYVDWYTFCVKASLHQLLWNYLDIFIVFASLVEIAFDVHRSKTTNSSGRVNVNNIRVIRVIRVFRLIRLVRMARFVRFVRALRMMVYSIMCTLKLIFWAMVLLATIIYIFSILFTSAATSYTTHRLLNADAPVIHGIETYWGSIGASMRSLFLSISGGISWVELIDPLTQVDTVWAYAFLVYISFTYFAVLNVVTGVFCQAAMHSTSEDQDSMLQTFLRHKQIYTERFLQLFHNMDNDGTGVIRIEDFAAKMCDEKVRNFFASLGLEITDALCLFDLFEEAEEKGVKVEEFVMGCLRLKGAARSSDMLSLLHQNRLLMEQLGLIADHFHLAKKELPTRKTVIPNRMIMETCLDDIAKVHVDSKASVRLSQI